VVGASEIEPIYPASHPRPTQCLSLYLYRWVPSAARIPLRQPSDQCTIKLSQQAMARAKLRSAVILSLG